MHWKYKKNQTLDVNTIPRSKHLTVLPVENSDESFLVALCIALFPEKISAQCSLIYSEQEKISTILKIAEDNLLIPVKDQTYTDYYDEDKKVSHGNCDQTLLEKKYTKIKLLLDTFR